MKILFLSDNFPPESNAPATRLFEHAIRWVRAGHEVTVITSAPNFPEGKLFPGYKNSWKQVEDLEGIRVVRVKTYITANEGFLKRTLDYVSFMLTSFLVGLGENRPDVLVATSPQFFCAVGGWALAAARRVPYVFELRDLWPASIVAVGAMKKSWIIRCLEKVELFLYRRAKLIIPVTDAFREDLIARGIDGSKIHVVRNGVDLSLYEPRDKDQKFVEEYGLQNKFVAGYMGTHGMAHALEKVVAAAEILREHPEIVFFFAGAGAERAHVEELVKSKGLENVRLIPRQSKDKMPALWSICDLCLVPLRNTPVFSTVIPSKIFEAMGMGVPILMSLPEGEATRIIETTGSGVCVRPEDPEDMAEKILELSKNAAQMVELKGKAREAAPQFSRDESADKMVRLLAEVVR